MPVSVLTLLPAAPTATESATTFPLTANNFFNSVYIMVGNVNLTVRGTAATALTVLPVPPQGLDATFAADADTFLASLPGMRTGVNAIITALSLPCSAITALPTIPSRGGDPVDFASRAAALVAALPTLRTELNAFITALIAYNPATGILGSGPLLEVSTGSGTLTLPSYSAGDVCFIHLFSADAGGTPHPTTPPSGWTLVANVNAYSNTVSSMVFRRVMDGTEGTTVAMTFTSGPSKMVRAIAVGGANTSGSVTEGAATAGNVASGTGTINLVCANVTTTGSNRLLLNFFGTCRGVNNTSAGTADAWFDIYQTAASAQSLNPDISASKQPAPTAGTYTGETRTKQELASGDIIWAGVSFAVVML